MPMDMEEDRPAGPAPVPPDLSRLGISELEGYIARLQAEIDRARALIEAKKALRGSADSLFRSRP